MSRLWKAIVAIVVWRSGRSRSRHGTDAVSPQADVASPRYVDPTERHTGASTGVQRAVVLLLVGCAACGFGFLALFVLHPQTQLLGLALGLALALLAGALILAGRRLVPQETLVEERPRPQDDREVREVAARVDASLDGITRRGLLAGAAGVAGAGLTAAVVIPVVALGPGVEDQLSHTPWRAGRALVDDEESPILASDVRPGSFITAFPRHADKDNLGSPVIVVRVDPSELRPPAARAGWAPEGIMAYSKICTHAACAISLFRSPLNPSTETRGPALVCPCHYSTFDVLDGGSVEFGPAGRALPQLPLAIDAATGVLIAAGPMSGPVGPSWWGDNQ